MATQTSDAQSAIDVLRGENERLSKELTAVTSQRDKALANHEASTKELAEFKKTVGDPEASKAKVAELEGKLRTVTHKAEFAKLAKAAGAHEDAIDDLYQLSGYTAAKDEIDAKALGSLVEDLKGKKAYAFAPPAEEGTGRTVDAAATPATPQLKAIPGGGRGQGHNPGNTGIKLTRAQLADPKFMLDPRNKELIADAAKNKRFA